MRHFALSASLWLAGASGTALAAAPVAPPPTARAAPTEQGSERADFGRAQLGGSGLSRVRSASIVPRTLSVSAHGGFFREDNLTAPGTDEHHLALVGVTLSPLSWLELSASSRSATHEQPAAGLRDAYLVNDIFLRAKVGQWVGASGLALALEGTLRVPPPVGRTTPITLGLSPGLAGLLTYDFNRGGVPLKFHLNSGVFIDNSVDFDDDTQSPTRRFALGINTYNQWQTGVGLESRIRMGGVYAVPFVEYTADVALGAEGGPGAAPMRVIPGLRVLPWKGLVLDASVELGVNRGSVRGMLPAPKYQAVLSVGYQGSLDTDRQVVERIVERPVAATAAAPAAPTTGRVKGRTLEAETKQPLADVIITLPGRTRLLADAQGVFVLTDVPPGPVQLRAEREGYAPTQVEGTVKPGGELAMELVLRKLPPPPPPLVTIRGTIVSEKDKAVAASVGAPGSGLPPRDFATGEYQLEVPAGDVNLEVSAPGYLLQGRRVQARPGETVVVDFILKPKPKTYLVILRKEKIEIRKQVHFATNRAVILPDSSPLLDQVASTILDNSNLRLLRIEGHTDNLGDDAHNLDLSSRRAQAVMRALLDRGVDPARLKAMGYGETRPIANNKLSPGRAKNRRVEFMIEEQD
jgi:outer membrane protein OmpA-like peptidoglycan-associated protein